MTDTLIVNAQLVNEGRQFAADLRIHAGRIEAIAPSLAARANEAVIDAAGKWLLPGVIDEQVHFREPGMEYKGGFDTEPAAAVAGGVTSFLDMPNTKPPTLDNAALEDKYQRAAGRSRANFRILFRCKQRQPRGDPPHRSEDHAWPEDLHGGVHRQHAGRRSGGARSDVRAMPHADHHPLRRHADDRGGDGRSACDLWRCDSSRPAR